ncbi:MAG: radical SAM protein [Candidatus Woesearchaeota archaeon]
MKVALVFPRYKYPSGDAPLGLLYIASYLKSNSLAELDVIDTTFHSSKHQAAALLARKDYDLVGFSLMTTMLKDALLLASILKKSNPKVRVVFGGPHPTVMPEETLREGCVDAVVIGEGEQTWLDLVNSAGDFSKVKGLWFKSSGSIVKNPKREFIPDLDKLPFPDLQLVDLPSYFDHWFQLDSVGKNLRGVNIISSRGCPYKCSFCQPTLTTLFGQRIRKRSPENIVAELRHWKRLLGINAFMFQDDTLIFDKDWVSRICDKLIESNLGLVFGANARANLVDYDIFALLKKAGLRKVFMGIESGSQRVLDEVYDKGITLRQVKKAVKVFNSLGIKVQGYFMIGAPSETLEEIKQTIRFSTSLGIDEATFSITTPLPHTFLFDKNSHLISADVADFDYYRNPVFSGKEVLPKAKLVHLKQRALLSFYLHPKHLLPTIRGFLTPSALKKSLVKLKRF